MEGAVGARSADDDLYEEWVAVLARVHDDVIRLHRNRVIWTGLREIVEANPAIPEPWHFVRWVALTYATTQAVGVRRQADERGKVSTLGWLLTSITKHVGVMTRQRFRYLHRNSADFVQKTADRTFDDFAGDGGRFVSAKKVQADLAHLQAMAAGTKAFVDTRIAHLDPRPNIAPPTFGELDAAIEELGRILERYTLLLKAEGLTSATPGLQYDWHSAFTVPWIIPRDRR